VSANRFKAEKDEEIAKSHNEFMEGASEHNYSSPALACKKDKKGEWSVCKGRPRLLAGLKRSVFLPKIHL
jgi:hypothetical protein